MNNQKTEAAVRRAGRINDQVLYELASTFENEVHLLRSQLASEMNRCQELERLLRSSESTYCHARCDV